MMRTAEVKVQSWPTKWYRIPIQKREAAQIGSQVVIDSPRHGYVVGTITDKRNMLTQEAQLCPWLVDVIDDSSYRQLTMGADSNVIDHSDYNDQENAVEMENPHS